MKREVKIIDITRKKDVYREATAIGRIKVRPSTLKKILEGSIEKGDVITISKLAAIIAVKKTSEILPFCHPIPITGINVEIYPTEDGLEVKVNVRTVAKTGVEMEALTGVMIGLLNIWDMIKKYEKDEKGQYPHTEIYGIRVISKIKGEVDDK